MKRGRRKIRFWLGPAVTAIALALPSLAQATNVVPNPSFEEGGCGARTPVVCGWEPSPGGSFLDRELSNAHSGDFSMVSGWTGETGSEFGPWGGQAVTVPASCAPIGPGAHPASFWYRDAGDSSSGGPGAVYLGATFFGQANCVRGPLASLPYAFVKEMWSTGGSWQQVAGTLVAPPGTRSALFLIGVYSFGCGNYTWCSVSATFDDLDVEDTTMAPRARAQRAR